MPNTRVEMKSRRHKRPQGYSSLNTWAKGRRPRQDFKSYPVTGYGPEIAGAQTGPSGPPGTEPVAAFYYVVGTIAPGEGGLYLAYPELQINDLSSIGTDNSAVWAAISAGDTIFLSANDGSGTNTLTVGSNDGSAGGVAEFTCSAQAPVGIFNDNEQITIWATAP